MNIGYWNRLELRRRIIDRDKVCQYCGKPVDEITGSIDHLIPESKGGTSTEDNLVAACKDCNSLKAARLPLDFFFHKYLRSIWFRFQGKAWKRKHA